MKNIIVAIILMCGFVLALYVGGWVMFISPILACASAFDAGLLTGTMIATTVLKCIFASFTGYIVFMLSLLVAKLFD